MWRSSNSNVVELRTFLTHSKSVEFYCDFSEVSNGVRKVDGRERKSHNTVLAYLLCGPHSGGRVHCPSCCLIPLPGRISSRPVEASHTHDTSHLLINQHIIIAVRWRALNFRCSYTTSAQTWTDNSIARRRPPLSQQPTWRLSTDESPTVPGSQLSLTHRPQWRN